MPKRCLRRALVWPRRPTGAGSTRYESRSKRRSSMFLKTVTASPACAKHVCHVVTASCMANCSRPKQRHASPQTCDLQLARVRVRHLILAAAERVVSVLGWPPFWRTPSSPLVLVDQHHSSPCRGPPYRVAWHSAAGPADLRPQQKCVKGAEGPPIKRHESVVSE